MNATNFLQFIHFQYVAKSIRLLILTPNSLSLLQLFDRSGVLYGELARFVLRVLGIKTKPRKVNQQPLGPNGLPLPGPHNFPVNQNYIEGPKAPAGAAWDNVWEHDNSN